jgi:hypothetical protein
VRRPCSFGLVHDRLELTLLFFSAKGGLGRQRMARRSVVDVVLSARRITRNMQGRNSDWLVLGAPDTLRGRLWTRDNAVVVVVAVFFVVTASSCTTLDVSACRTGIGMRFWQGRAGALHGRASASRKLTEQRRRWRRRMDRGHLADGADLALRHKLVAQPDLLLLLPLLLLLRGARNRSGLRRCWQRRR